jgi:hypothetical protein
MISNGETMPDVRIVRVTGTGLLLSLALDHVPPIDSTVTLRWAAAPRGRYTLRCDVVAVDGNRVEVTYSGKPTLVQTRSWVRGGGGEPIVLLRPGHEEVRGVVHDLSEQAVRAHFTDIEAHPGQDMQLQVQLDDEVVEFVATAHKVSSMRQQVPRRGPLSVEMVAIFKPDEHQAKLVRRYILRHQLQARARGELA